MKLFNLFSVSALVLGLSACSMYGGTYFGSRHPATDSVQTFYAAKDIKQPYKVIGHMISPIASSESSQERVKLRLINRAKQVGADALIFSDITREAHLKTTDDYSIKAEAIVFTDK
ncbi:hypothetical protein [Pedobacter caeni]|uniref:Heavy-metal-binding n=1 Tax=Pedobacter caeni TaxID=288992 RepID=A0A1M4U7H7_9SPHI|nr:hypothetical protein [Pedobacter caeni]SHE52556.1 hypothetical protein SAMN04488522_101454 [Pedobacter caeni]